MIKRICFCCIAIFLLSAPAKAEEYERIRCHMCVIQDAYLEEPLVAIPYIGDLWMTTWADDDNIYSSFGDGAGRSGCLAVELPLTAIKQINYERDNCIPVDEVLGPDNPDFCPTHDCSQCYPLCDYVRNGVVRLAGSPPNFQTCPGFDQCLVGKHIPFNDPLNYRDMKPSSLVFVNDLLIMHVHEPSGEPRRGYLAYSDDYGRTWKQIGDSPWGEGSPFRVGMFLQMGQNYSLNKDGYLYLYGIEAEVHAGGAQPQSVYLARVELDYLLNYDRYEYYAGIRNINQVWSHSQGEAVPLEGVQTAVQSSVMYHEGIDRYLLMGGIVGIVPGVVLGNKEEPMMVAAGLFEAKEPWGPWNRAAYFYGGYVGSFITKDAGEDYVYITGAGNTLTYNLNVAKLQFKTKKGRRPMYH